MMKNTLVVLGIIALAAGFANAQAMVDDDFNDGVMASQWASAGTGTVVESGGVVNVTVGSGQDGGYGATGAYGLSGDFDVRIDVDVVSYGGTTAAGYQFLTYLSVPIDANNIMNLHYRTNNGTDWFALAIYKGNSSTYALSDYLYGDYAGNDVTLRIVREGTTFSSYISAMGADTWTLVASTAASTAGATASFAALTAAGISGDVDFDNFLVNPVPEPATMSILALGMVGAVIRRRRA